MKNVIVVLLCFALGGSDVRRTARIAMGAGSMPVNDSYSASALTLPSSYARQQIITASKLVVFAIALRYLTESLNNGNDHLFAGILPILPTIQRPRRGERGIDSDRVYVEPISGYIESLFGIDPTRKALPKKVEIDKQLKVGVHNLERYWDHVLGRLLHSDVLKIRELAALAMHKRKSKGTGVAEHVAADYIAAFFVENKRLPTVNEIALKVGETKASINLKIDPILKNVSDKAALDEAEGLYAEVNEAMRLKAEGRRFYLTHGRSVSDDAKRLPQKSSKKVRRKNEARLHISKTLAEGQRASGTPAGTSSRPVDAQRAQGSETWFRWIMQLNIAMRSLVVLSSKNVAFNDRYAVFVKNLIDAETEESVSALIRESLEEEGIVQALDEYDPDWALRWRIAMLNTNKLLEIIHQTPDAIRAWVMTEPDFERILSPLPAYFKRSLLHAQNELAKSA